MVQHVQKCWDEKALKTVVEVEQCRFLVLMFNLLLIENGLGSQLFIKKETSVSWSVDISIPGVIVRGSTIVPKSVWTRVDRGNLSRGCPLDISMP